MPFVTALNHGECLMSRFDQLVIQEHETDLPSFRLLIFDLGLTETCRLSC